MNNQGQFGLFETTLFITLIITSAALYTGLAVVVKKTGTAGWYETLISCAVSIVFFLMLYLLMKRFQGMDLIEIYETVLGKIIGKVVGLIFACYLLYYTAVNLRQFIEMIKIYVLPSTKDSIIYASFMGVIILVVYKGLESIVRLSYISFFPILAGILLILVMAYPYYNPDYLKPYMGYGLGKTLTTGFLQSPVYDGVMTLGIIIKSIHGTNNLRRAGLVSLILSAIIFSISVLAYLMMFTYSVGGENVSGMFHIARTIFFSRYFQRLETVFLIPWVVTSVLTVSYGYYLSLYVYCTIFKIENYNPLIFPFSFIIYIFAAMPRNIIEFIQVNLAFARNYGLGISYGIPLLVLLIAVITGKRGEKLNAKKN